MFWSVVVDIFITNIITEYDQKAESYGINRTQSSSKQTEKYSFYSDIDELNQTYKRTDCETKCGDQRCIVDFLQF